MFNEGLRSRLREVQLVKSIQGKKDHGLHIKEAHTLQTKISFLQEKINREKEVNKELKIKKIVEDRQTKSVFDDYHKKSLTRHHVQMGIYKLKGQLTRQSEEPDQIRLRNLNRNNRVSQSLIHIPRSDTTTPSPFKSKGSKLILN